jgi:hypothetical protein
MEFEWFQYPNSDGQYAYHGNLVLNAHPSGAWSVYHGWSKVRPRNSEMAPTLGPKGIEAAKQQAQDAAIQMTNELHKG